MESPFLYNPKLYTAYFKKDSDYYIKRAEQFYNGNQQTFNIYTFFFGIFWFIYRKMYKEAFLIMAAIVVISFLEEMLTLNAGSERFLDLIINFGIAIATAMFGNYLYIKKTEQVIQKALAKGMNGDDLIAYLSKKDGVNLWVFVIAGLGVVCLIWYLYLVNNRA